MTAPSALGSLPAQQVEPKLGADAVEVSFVMPCLNERLTLPRCIEMAQQCIRDHNLSAEIVIADNGSTDGSQDLARSLGARVVDVTSKGYGNALMGGFRAARGTYIIMGDSDASYDFGEGIKFVRKLREGYDMVMGCRFPWGGGRIMPNAMPWKHKWLGNPVLTFIGRVLFKCPATDFHCGIRAFRRDSYLSWDVNTPGMEFASELVIKSVLRGAKITEVGVTLHKDGRDRPPHLRSWRDGWRHLKFMLMMSPRWTLFLPGVTLLALGLLLGAAVLVTGGLTIGSATLSLHSLVAASVAVILGYQLTSMAAAIRAHAATHLLGPASAKVHTLAKFFSFERGLIFGGLGLLAGLACIVGLTIAWANASFGPLNIERTMPWMIVGATLAVLGAQTIVMSILTTMLKMAADARR
jgi:glycosyltransferase involved in cell wall biosynthesis